ncbi:hypothetical protein ABEB36_010799 [Hypothenemus hampei]|uniref:Uncharacterized protein n=1 Tax=Hypothenemus hampei TaxID=57062 RepID=A0ABD1EFV7_HYPHA
MVFTNGEKTDMLRCFYLSNENCQQASNLYNNRTFLNLHVSLATFGSFEKPKNIRFRNAGNNEEEELNILAHFRAFPTTSTREATRELDISRHKIRKTLKKYGRKPYIVHLVQNLHPGDHQNRINFCNWVLNEGRQYLPFILWTDESKKK